MGQHPLQKEVSVGWDLNTQNYYFCITITLNDSTRGIEIVTWEIPCDKVSDK